MFEFYCILLCICNVGLVTIKPGQKSHGFAKFA